MSDSWTIVGSVAAVAALIPLGVQAWRLSVRGWHKLRITLTDRRARREQVKRERERQERIARATAEGKQVVVSRRGRRPVEVTWNIGPKTYYFCGDMEAYAAAVRSGQCPARQTFHGSPPKLF